MNKAMPLIRSAVIIVLALFLLSFLKDFLIKSAVEMASPKIIGAKVRMGSFSLGLLTHKVQIKDFRMYNPPGYPDEIFLVMPRMVMDVDIAALVSGKMHFPHVIFNMEKMVIFKDKEGKLNIDSLKIVEEQKEANKGKPMKLPVFKIDLLELNIGKVILEDFTHAPPVHVEAYDVAIKDQKIRDINGLPKLVTLVIVDAVKPTAIRSAGLLAAEAVLGIGFLPAVAITLATAQDEVKADLAFSSGRVYEEGLKLARELGSVKKEDRQKGQVLAKIYGCDVTINVQDKGWSKSQIRIKARKYMLARLETANGLLYLLTQRLQ